MKMKIKIFESEKTIDLEKFIDSRALVCANSGGGFNNSLSRLNTLGILTRSNGLIKINPEQLEI